VTESSTASAPYRTPSPPGDLKAIECSGGDRRGRAGKKCSHQGSYQAPTKGSQQRVAFSSWPDHRPTRKTTTKPTGEEARPAHVVCPAMGRPSRAHQRRDHPPGIRHRRIRGKAPRQDV
jgi:hypothetical protein